ncbi:MAG: hypothetical protein J0H57_07200, partial [Rhodospirillales bacterium]|nr:hypothetical protein [Rhodospirillales bacterium]
WRPGAPAIPRHALLPLLELVRMDCPTVCQEVERMIAGRWLSEPAVVAQAGAHLWPAAAQALIRAQTPPHAHSAGLPVAVLCSLARDVGAVLAQAMPLQAFAAAAARGLELRLEGLLDVVAQLHATRPHALGMMMVLMHARLPDAIEPLLAAEAECEPEGGCEARPLAHAAALARDMLIERLSAEGGAEAVIGRTMLAELPERVRQAARLLQLLGNGTSPERRVLLAQVGGRLLTGCLRRFEAALGAEFLTPLADLSAAVSDAEVERLEATARALRNAREQVRLLGGGEDFDALLRRAVEQVAAMRVDTSVARADQARLMEILAGPEEAWALLQAVRA